ncbi:MAG: VCBS repeat-containing protein, partial [Calditrichaeota bacterium]|nr:VCBS repeat-containing protein [Calditrichota bacterium]
PNLFCWQGALDVDGDPLTYRLRIFDDSLDIDIPNITDTCFTIPGGTFVIGKQHRWAVLADDGTVTVSGDTASFFTPPFLFTDIHAGLSRVGNGDGVWGDYDNDGDLDLAIAGQRDSLATVNPFSGIFRNDNGSFVDINANLAQLSASILAWGDYDNDNDLDLFLGGYPGIGSPNEAYIYRNDNGSFVDINADLTGVSNGTAEWGDY